MKARSLICVTSDREVASVTGQIVSENFQDVESHSLWVELSGLGAHGESLEKRRSGSWHQYTTAPWQLANEKHITPDLIYINGLFPQAAFLLSLFMSAPGTRMLLKLRGQRSHQFFEDFIKPDKIAGEIASFTVPRRLNRLSLYRQLEEKWEVYA